MTYSDYKLSGKGVAVKGTQQSSNLKDILPESPAWIYIISQTSGIQQLNRADYLKKFIMVTHEPGELQVSSSLMRT